MYVIADSKNIGCVSCQTMAYIDNHNKQSVVKKSENIDLSSTTISYPS